MRNAKRNSLIAVCSLLLIALPVAVGAQETSRRSGDPELDRVNEMIRQAWRDFDQFVGAGGKASDPNHPNLKWSAALWQYREQHPGTPASARATSEALHFLVHANRIDEAHAKADTLSLDDPAWKYLLNVLSEAAAEKGDYRVLIGKAQALLDHSKDREVRVRAQFNLAQAYWKTEETDQAKLAFQKVVTDYQDTPFAKDAQGNIYEIELLNPGQPAPVFANRSIAGEPVSISDLKGKVVLLYFWASW